MRITKVYTRTGDRGSTRLVGGEEVSKDTDRVEAYGDVDELNAVIGIVRTLMLNSPGEKASRMEPTLERIQHDLFDLGAQLATAPGSKFQPDGLRDSASEWLENSIDQMNESLPPLVDFVLPGGGMLGAHFHLARTVCRRAERRAVTLSTAAPETPVEGLIYLNRLSDWLFVAGRWAAQAQGERELIWRRDLPEVPS
jgi:cob(I)alamin adenosyltransferase